MIVEEKKEKNTTVKTKATHDKTDIRDQKLRIHSIGTISIYFPPLIQRSKVAKNVKYPRLQGILVSSEADNNKDHKYITVNNRE